jgi:hypothetical protein
VSSMRGARMATLDVMIPRYGGMGLAFDKRPLIKHLRLA